MIFRSTRRVSAAICATWRQPRGSLPSPSTLIRPRSPPAVSRSSGGGSQSRRTRSATGCRWSTAGGGAGGSRPAGAARRPRAGGAPRRRAYPPGPFALGQSPEMALAHFKRIADATDLPLIVFQYPLATGQGYPRDTLLKMVDEVPSIRAIKDWAGNVPQHEMHIRTLQSLPRPVNVLASHSAWLLSSLVRGCNGLLSGSGSVIADLQAQLFHAVKANDLAEARRLNDRIYPLARVFYADPWADMHNRMKEALVLLG